MTEEEWLACADPEPMLDYLRDKVSERKLRLFACACCRIIWDCFKFEVCRTAVEMSERFADGTVGEGELLSVAGAVDEMRVWGGYASEAAYCATVLCVESAQDAAAREFAPWPDLLAAREARHACLLHDVAGNPFRPVSFDFVLLSPTVVSLAQSAYDKPSLPLGELDHARLAVLSDALEEAGCIDAAILGHLRSPGPHVRGCWALDLLLNRS